MACKKQTVPFKGTPEQEAAPVSYTHLDVYKRQTTSRAPFTRPYGPPFSMRTALLNYEDRLIERLDWTSAFQIW